MVATVMVTVAVCAVVFAAVVWLAARARSRVAMMRASALIRVPSVELIERPNGTVVRLHHAQLAAPSLEQLAQLPASGWTLLQGQDERGEFVAIVHSQLGILRRWRIDPENPDHDDACKQVLADARAIVGELTAR